MFLNNFSFISFLQLLQLFAYAAFPLSCDPLRSPRLAIRSWSWNFSEISRLDTRWLELIRFDTICCDWMRFVNFKGHDLSRSDLPFEYDHIRSTRIVSIKSTIVSRSDTNITIGFPELGRSGACRYVPIRLSRTDALHYDMIRLWSRCLSRSW